MIAIDAHKGESPLDNFCDDRLKTSRRRICSRNQNRQDIVNRSTKSLNQFNVFYCACIIVRVSDDFYDDRHESHLVESRLNTKIISNSVSYRSL